VGAARFGVRSTVSSGGPVAQEHDPGAEWLGVDELQARQVGGFGEQPQAPAQDDGVDEEAVLVDEAVGGEGARTRVMLPVTTMSAPVADFRA
jgi:hypothetical protein